MLHNLRFEADGATECVAPFRGSLRAAAQLTVMPAMYNLTENEPSAHVRKRQPSEARMLATWTIREMSDSTLAELAQRVGRDASAMSAAAM